LSAKTTKEKVRKMTKEQLILELCIGENGELNPVGKARMGWQTTDWKEKSENYENVFKRNAPKGFVFREERRKNYEKSVTSPGTLDRFTINYGLAMYKPLEPIEIVEGDKEVEIADGEKEVEKVEGEKEE